MALETRLLTESSSFAIAASTWATGAGLLNEEGVPTSIYPIIIGMPSDSADLGGFNIGIIQNNRTIKQALQDLETAVDSRMFAGNNLSDLPNPATARTNLGLGSAATWPVGTSGSTIPLMSTINSWSGKQSFGGGASVTTAIDITGTSGSQTLINLLNGTSRRWAVYKEETVDSATSTGSDFRIARFNNSGVKIDDPFSISRATGLVSLAQPLPITSGGTGANSLATMRTQLSINNVDNTADINKPISSLTQTALNNKFDKAGGSIAGFITATAHVRGAVLVADGSVDEGGQIVLGYRNNIGVSGQANGTWNIDVTDVNTLRIFRQGNTGSIYTPIEVNEAGNSTLSGNGEVVTVSGSTGVSQGISVRNNNATGSVAGSGFVGFKNAENTFVSHVVANMNVDGGSDLSFSVTAAGNRASDRRIENFKITPTEILAGVPINGRCFPRLADGTSVNFNWNGQPGQPTWLWGGNDGTNMFVYSPSNLSVNSANNSTQLQGVAGGNAGGYIRRTSDAGGNGSLSRQLVVSGNDAINDVWSSPIEIREVAQVAATNTASEYAPALLFHWGSLVAGAIKLHSDGSFRFQRQASTVTYTNLWGANFYSNSNFHVSGSGGMFFDSYNRGIAVAEAGGSYGHLNTVGTGLNGYSGYSVNTWIALMSNGSESGLYSSSAGNWLLRFDTSSDAFFPGNITAYSDERLKQNIRPIDNVAERRKGMAKAAIMYERDGETRIGFGAQTLELVVPEVVKTADDLLGTKSVNYGDPVAILAADAQVLSDRIEVLENTIAILMAKIEKAGL
jgi:hypothetical protein